MPHASRFGNLSARPLKNMQLWLDDSLLGPRARGGPFASRAFCLALPEV